VVECKSYLISQGVLFRPFAEGAKFAERYKLFTKEKIKSTALNRLGKQLEECGLSTVRSIKLYLAAATWPVTKIAQRCESISPKRIGCCS
jgi:hypothetical protein